MVRRRRAASFKFQGQGKGMKIFENLFKKIKKEKRPSVAPSAVRTGVNSRPPPPPEIQQVSEKHGWVSPIYAKSRPVTLDTKRLVENRCVGYMCTSYEAESYKVLRTQILQKTQGKGGTTIMITSALPGDGKTITAINLAFTFTKEFMQTVLLVDSDLRQQKIHEYLGVRSTKGLIDYLIDGMPLSALTVWPSIEKMTFISGGRTVIASSELLNSPRMKDLVKELKGRYPERYVLFDVAPVLAGADALAFAPQVDYILFVVRAGVTPLPDIRRAIDLLPKEKILGFVLNGAETVPKRYYGYGYGPERGSPAR